MSFSVIDRRLVRTSRQPTFERGPMSKRTWVSGVVALLGLLATSAYILIKGIGEELAAGLTQP